MSFACETEMHEMKVCLYRCTLWLINGTFEPQCLITFRLTFLSQLMQRAAEFTKIRQDWRASAVRERVENTCVQ